MAEQRTRRPHGPMGGPGRGMIPGEKSKDFKNSIEKLVRYLGRYWYAIVAVMIFAAVSTVFSVAGPKVMARATNALVEGLGKKIAGTGSIDFTYIAKVLLFTLGLYICSAVFSFIQGMIMTGITQKTCYRMRKEISEKINRMPMKYFESRTYGEVLSRITNDVDTLGQSLNQSVTQIITSVATLVGTLVMMISISGIMTLISLVILPVSAILISFIIKHSQKYFRQQQEYLGHINGQVEEVYGGHLVVQAYNKQESTIKKFEDTNQILFQSAWKSQFLSGLMQPIMQFVGNLGYVGVAISGGLLAIRGTIGVGEIQAFIQYVRNFTQPIQQIAQVANMLQSMAAASERVFEFLDEEEEELWSYIAGNVNIEREFEEKEEAENILNKVDKVFQELRAKQQPIVSDVITTKIWLCLEDSEQQYSFISKEVAEEWNKKGTLPTQRELARKYGRDEASISRTVRTFLEKLKREIEPVSYTHLTLPTKRIV